MLIRLATRASALARAQTALVASALERAGRGRGMDVTTELVTVTSDGDRMTGSLVGLSETGVFVTAVRDAVLEGRADVAVHSLKDMPVAPHEGLTVEAILARGDARDAWCSAGPTWQDMAAGARIGTSSPRRAAQVLALRPDLDVSDIRGNVDTRLTALGDAYDAVVLAAAGLDRLDRAHQIIHRFDADVMMPAPGQGALAVEVAQEASAALRALVAAMDHAPTRACVTAERAVLATLQAGCATPVAAHATSDGHTLRLQARVVRPDGMLQLNETARGPVSEAAGMGRRAGFSLLSRGAARLMD